MSEIIEAVTSMIEVIADNPASILIVLGFISIMLAIFVPIGTGIQVLLGVFGFFMMIIGILVHVLWLQN
jgi:hypothetical protein